MVKMCRGQSKPGHMQISLHCSHQTFYTTTHSTHQQKCNYHYQTLANYIDHDRVERGYWLSNCANSNHNKNDNNYSKHPCCYHHISQIYVNSRAKSSNKDLVHRMVWWKLSPFITIQQTIMFPAPKNPNTQCRTATTTCLHPQQYSSQNWWKLYRYRQWNITNGVFTLMNTPYQLTVTIMLTVSVWWGHSQDFFQQGNSM